MYDLSTHPYGCRVLQRCLEHLPEDQTRPLMDELHKYTINLMQDQFGVCRMHFSNNATINSFLQNYVIQFILEHGQPQDKALVINKLRGQMLQMARHKFASNVCEKALVTTDIANRNSLIDEIMTPKQDGVSPIITMMKDQFASEYLTTILCIFAYPLLSADYVLQRALSVSEGEQRELLISKIRPHLATMRRYSSAYSKHLLSST